MAVRQARAWFLLLLLGASCKPAQTSAREFAVEREQMVKEQVAMRGVTDERVLKAMRKVPREQFVPEQIRGQSYSDGPLPIGYDQTISQPFVVAFMTEKLGLRPTDRVLEIGTGSGYQAAILAELAAKVYTIEIVEPLGKRAEANPAATRLQKRPGENRRRLSRLAGIRAIRRGHRDLRARPRAATAGRAN